MHTDKGNAASKWGYSCLMQALVQEWRRLWSQTEGTTDQMVSTVCLTTLSLTTLSLTTLSHHTLPAENPLEETGGLLAPNPPFEGEMNHSI